MKKRFRKPVLIALLTLLSCASVFAQITITVKNKTIKEILPLVEKESGYSVFYNNEITDLNKKADLSVTNATIEKTLNALLRNTNITYQIKADKQVLLTIKPVAGKDTNSPADSKKAEGTVTDKAGQGIIGATVKVKETAIATTTDVNGRFSIDAPAGSVLVISYMGFITREVAVNGTPDMKIVLEEDAKALEEVVVVGYKVQKKTSLTAAVGVLNADNIASKQVSNISGALAGQVPGLITAQSSGEVGNDDTEIYIRGVATLGNSKPLLVVDGVPRGDLSMFDVNIVESITVLKDAAAVAPYGMAGANGVILVTTKKGKTGKPTLTYNGYQGFQNPTVNPERLNAYDYALMRNIATINADPTAAAPYSAGQLAGYKKTVDGAADADPDRYPNTGAMDMIVNKNTLIGSHNISLSGGTENVKYYMGLGYFYQEGLWNTSYMDKYNLLANVEAKATKTTTVKLSINGNYRDINNPYDNERTVMSYVTQYRPVDAYWYSNGFLGNSSGKTLESMIRTGYRQYDGTNLFTQLSVEQELPFLKGLSAKTVLSYDPTTVYQKSWKETPLTYYNINTATTPYTYLPVVSPEKPSLYTTQNNSKSYTAQFFLSYNNTFGKHGVSAMAVMEANKTRFNVMSASRTNYDINIDEIDMGNSNSSNWGNGGSSGRTAQVGYVYRVGYEYAQKYLFEASGRYDGNYYFAPGKKYGFFPAFSAGWRISEERFIKEKLTFIDNLKLRASWGQSGNLAGGPFQYSSAMNVYGSAYAFDNYLYQGVSESAEPNRSITWEKANKTNIGLDVTLWNGLLGLEADVFYEKRNNMLLSPNNVVPVEYGIGISQVNAGIMSNKGIDLALSSKYRFSPKFRLEGNFNFTFAKNKIIQMFENPLTLNDPLRARTGLALNTPFGLRSLGLYQQGDFDFDGILKQGLPIPQFGPVAPGDIRWDDANGDGVINGADEVALGYPILPQVIYGFATRAYYQNFDFGVLFQGAARSSTFIEGGLAFPFIAGETPTIAAKDYWTPDNPGATFPRLYGTGGNANNFIRGNNDFFRRSGSYLRLKNIEVGYTLPKGVLQKLTIQSLRVYMSGQNLFTFSDVEGLYDPEMNQSGAGDSNTRGWYSPQRKVISLGLNVTF